MKHPQPPTPIQTDNLTAEGVINSNIQPKRTKSMDMRFHWLRCRAAQQQFRIYWKPGGQNLANYYTKHHSPAHHRRVRAEFLTKYKEVHELRERNKREHAAHSCKGVLDLPAKPEVKAISEPACARASAPKVKTSLKLDAKLASTVLLQ